MSCDCDAGPPPKCPTGIPAWVLTFADLMSLLLAFFVLLFSFSEMDQQKYKQVAGSMADAFGVQREVQVKDPPKGINIIATEFSAGVPQDKAVNEMNQITTDDFRQYVKLPTPASKETENDSTGSNEVINPDDPSAAFTDALEQEKQRLMVALEDEVKDGYVEIEIKDRDIIIRIQERGSFSSGSNLLINPFHDVLEKMARTIGAAPGSVIVAGHTDSRPIHTEQFRSNWELSASRAVTVVHVLMQEGSIPKDRFRVEGFGDTQPIDTNDTPEGRARNRRVEIALHYDEGLVGLVGPLPREKMYLPRNELYEQLPEASKRKAPAPPPRSWADDYSLERNPPALSPVSQREPPPWQFD